MKGREHNLVVAGVDTVGLCLDKRAPCSGMSVGWFYAKDALRVKEGSKIKITVGVLRKGEKPPVLTGRRWLSTVGMAGTKAVALRPPSRKKGLPEYLIWQKWFYRKDLKRLKPGTPLCFFVELVKA